MVWPAGASFDTETIALMRAVLEETTAKLPHHLRTSSGKVELAELILKAAAGGERDPNRLGTVALIGVLSRHPPSSTGVETRQSRVTGQ